ncbi:MAG: ribbon-helix-helix protein, CopG family [Anaerolineae bacterium]|nr:ribbon-helix-helix protein, CopG family [Anaerolineae bacterium]
MVRKQIYIEPQQETLLKRLARMTGVTEAEIIRRAIEQQARTILFPHRDLSAWQEERAFINHLIQQGSVPGGRTWHREDLYER